MTKIAIWCRHENDNIIGIVSDLYNGSEYVIYEDEIISKACTEDAVGSYNKYMEELQVYLNQINLREFSQSRRLKYSLDELLIDELSID